jgi:amino acid adenylation domain-containing protein
MREPKEDCVSPRALRLLPDALLASTDRHPAKTIVIADGAAHPYEALVDAASRLARALQDNGVRRGDRVAVYLENSWDAVVAIYGTMLAGAVLTVINPQTKTEKLAYMLADSEARALVTEKPLAATFLAALADAPNVECVVCAGGRPGGDQDAAAPPRYGLLELSDVLAGTDPSPARPGVIPIDLAALIYTSGSTGNPKGVMLTHQNMVFAAGSIAEYLRLDASDRIVNVLPFAFDYGLYQLLMTTLLGATLVVERSFVYPVPVLRRVIEHEVTVFPIVPTIGATLLSLNRSGGWTFPTIRRVTNTAAALPGEFIPRLATVFPNALIFAMYGLTECKRVAYLEPEKVQQKPTSVGKAIPGTEVFLLSPDGEPVAPGETGVLHVRGPHVMVGYWKQPELTAAMLKPGRMPGERVLCTHDFFTMDADGDLYFVGRSDDIIKTRGEKVSPVEVENALHRIPGVREAAVIGVPDELLGEAIRAFVVLDDGAALSEQYLKRECMQRLESFMVPRDIVFVNELPKTTTAKVSKRLLREFAFSAVPEPSTSGD